MSDTLITFADINEHALSIGDAIMYSIPQVWDEALWNVILEFEARDYLPKVLHLFLRTLIFYFMALVSLSILSAVKLLSGLNAWIIGGYSSLANATLSEFSLSFQGGTSNLIDIQRWKTSGIPVHAVTIGIAVVLLIRKWEDRDLEDTDEEKQADDVEEDEDSTAAAVEDFCEDDFGRIWVCIWLISFCGTVADAVIPLNPYSPYWPEVILGLVVMWLICPKPKFIRTFNKGFCAKYPILCTRKHYDDDGDEDVDGDDGWETEDETVEITDENIGD